MRRFSAYGVSALLAVAALFLAKPAGAQPPPPSPPPAADISEMVQMFGELCMQAFPDAANVAAFLAARPVTAMTPEEVKRYLHDDPGAGWYLKTDVALYGITIEQPPFHTCAIRRMTPEGVAPGGVGALMAAEKAYAASIGGGTTKVGPNKVSMPNGPDVLAFALGVSDAAGKPSDTFGLFLSNYHHRPPESWVPDATGGVGVEIRLSRQAIGR